MRRRILDEEDAQRASPPTVESWPRRAGLLAPDVGGAALLNEAILDRVVGEVGVRLRVHLLQDPRAVRAHRLVAEEQLVGDVADGAAGRELAEDLEFPLAQLLVRAAGRSPPTSSASICATAGLMYLRPCSSVRMACTTCCGTASLVM